MEGMGEASPGAPSLWSAYAQLRGRRFVECIATCHGVLRSRPQDPGALTLLMRAQAGLCAGTGLAKDVEGVPAEAAFPALGPHPGLRGGPTAAGGVVAGQQPQQMPGTAAPGTAFARGGRVPTAQARALGTAAGGRRERLGTSRLGTASFRLGTAAAASDQQVLDPRRLPDVKGLGRVRCDYMLQVAGDARGALDVCAGDDHAPDDWWWNLRKGVCHWHLGMFRDAQDALEASARANPWHPPTLLWMASALACDNKAGRALELLRTAADQFPDDPRALECAARLLGGASGPAPKTCHDLHARVAEIDPRHVGSAAYLARHAFLYGQPEVALRYYQRLVHQGVATAELWANLGLCCFECSQYDMALGCFSRALADPKAADAVLADVWYNAGLVAVALGELRLAGQCLKLAVHVDSAHLSAFVNMGTLEFRRGALPEALSEFKTAASAGAVPEACFGAALLEANAGNLHEANTLLALLGPGQHRLPAARDLAEDVLAEFRAA